MNTVHYAGTRGHLTQRQDVLIEQENGTLKRYTRSILILGVNIGVVKINYRWYEVETEDNLYEDGTHIHVENGNEAIWIHRQPKPAKLVAKVDTPDQQPLDQEVTDQDDRDQALETTDLMMVTADISKIEADQLLSRFQDACNDAYISLTAVWHFEHDQLTLTIPDNMRLFDLLESVSTPFKIQLEATIVQPHAPDYPFSWHTVIDEQEIINDLQREF